MSGPKYLKKGTPWKEAFQAEWEAERLKFYGRDSLPSSEDEMKRKAKRRAGKPTKI